MTNEQAQAKAKKRWGKAAATRNGGHFSSEDRRQAAAARCTELRLERDALQKERAERLKALDWLIELDARVSALSKEINEELPKTHHHRFDVGRIGGIADFRFFEVLGSGDTWEQAFAKAESK